MKFADFCKKHAIKPHVAAGLLDHMRQGSQPDLPEAQLETAYESFMGRRLSTGAKRPERTPPPPADPPGVPSDPPAGDEKKSAKGGGSK
ncbi:MAG: hypothetical protein HS115_11750 [Spirochaetales bacterium]|nr:hypothetical protein [Spirochaetales bacterium]